ncbi:MAG: hypothetical protein MUF21_13755 [Gemmatimonadaceae bacterium]|nr:hypothetical protein [Gemmatimonadaceae bacterium]
MTHRIPIAAATVSAVAFALLASVASLVVPRTAAAQATAAARASRPARDAAVMSRRTAPPALVVSGAWLAARLGRDTSLVLVHVGATRGEYDAGHIAGARWLALDDYAPANRADTLDRELPAPEALRALLEPLGVADGRHIVVIGQPLPAARFAFTMAAMGREWMRGASRGARWSRRPSPRSRRRGAER